MSYFGVAVVRLNKITKRPKEKGVKGTAKKPQFSARINPFHKGYIRHFNTNTFDHHR